MRTFLIPKIGVGTREDPRRPAYVREAGLNWTGNDDADFYIVEVYGTDKECDDLGSQPDVVELKDDTQPIDAEVKGRASVLYAGKVDVAREATGKELIASLKTGIMVNQVVRGIPADLLDLVKAKLLRA